ncbi:hypothetical protein CIMG_06649 [Paecilomyces variotii No. 5]|uniref:Ketoreductase domain-containing protein n=1 Tax=Byssochlamys spectabilis (strain No. 5 / NBRC 109023) TaxID=1356009 RepID=V5HRL7_BYSSN|nr:hypothetical protein CIMG_06649 [Paecilomyces variotii No. 5]
MSPRVWFVTGCSTGFGRELVLQALKRGDKVIATARNVSKLADLETAGAKTMSLDVTADLASLKQSAATAYALYDRIDILVNNAGYLSAGSVEETSPEETFSQFNTNVFGLLNVNRAFLPYLRAQKSGVIANFSSIGAWRGSAGVGIYCASKWAVAGISESLNGELAEFGIKSISIEPGYFRSKLLDGGNRSVIKNHIPEYDGTAARKGMQRLEVMDNKQPGDIVKGTKVIIDVLTQSGTAAGKDIPLRLALGADSYEIISGKCQQTIALLNEWKDISTPTNHDDVAGKL